jgi:hypothetical protein
MTSWDSCGQREDGDISMSINNFPNILEERPAESDIMFFGEGSDYIFSGDGHADLNLPISQLPCTPPETNSNASQAQSTHPPLSRGLSSTHSPSRASASSKKTLANQQQDSECVIGCLQIISRLESYIQARLTILDLVLDTVRQAVHQLNRLVDMQQHEIAPRLITLFSTIVLQIVELFEGACAAFILQRDQPDVISSSKHSTAASKVTVAPLSGSEVPPTAPYFNNTFSFGFGSLSLPIEDQHDMKARLVVRELRQSYEVALRIRILLKRMTSDSAMVAGRDQCFQEVANRLRSLVERIDRKK